MKRSICSKCVKPTNACLCASLPLLPIELKRCRVVVLQHPHEQRRKNRSLPLVELCLRKEDLHVVVARRLGEEVDPRVTKMISENAILLFPSKDATTLKEGLEELRSRPSKEEKEEKLVQSKEKITLVFLDATWKFALEMEKINTRLDLWPKDLVRAELSPREGAVEFQPSTYAPRRFDIRTPPSDSHLSTAECIAWVVSIVEEDEMIYETLVKPLDCMAKQWRDFRLQKEIIKGKKRKL